MSHITTGVTLFSMTNEWLAGRYTLPGLVDEVGRRGLGPGVEIVGFQSLRGFPRPDPTAVREFRDAIERNGLVATSLGSNADIALHRDHVMTTDESIEYMRVQIAAAVTLGFGIVRIQAGLSPEVIEHIEPIAAASNVVLGLEIHAPQGPATPTIMAAREVYDRLQSAHLGFIPDFSACMRAIPGGMFDLLRTMGLSEAGVAALDTAWRADGAPFERYAVFAHEAARLGEPEAPVGHARLVFTMFGRQDVTVWREIMDQVVHVHGKFYDIDESGRSPSIDYPALMAIFDGAYRGSMSTEWEGHAYADEAQADAFDLVARHQAMCRSLLAAV